MPNEVIDIDIDKLENYIREYAKLKIKSDDYPNNIIHFDNGSFWIAGKKKTDKIIITDKKDLNKIKELDKSKDIIMSLEGNDWNISLPGGIERNTKNNSNNMRLALWLRFKMNSVSGSGKDLLNAINLYDSICTLVIDKKIIKKLLEEEKASKDSIEEKQDEVKNEEQILVKENNESILEEENLEKLTEEKEEEEKILEEDKEELEEENEIEEIEKNLEKLTEEKEEEKILEEDKEELEEENEIEEIEENLEKLTEEKEEEKILEEDKEELIEESEIEEETLEDLNNEKQEENISQEFTKENLFEKWSKNIRNYIKNIFLEEYGTLGIDNYRKYFDERINFNEELICFNLGDRITDKIIFTDNKNVISSKNINKRQDIMFELDNENLSIFIPNVKTILLNKNQVNDESKIEKYLEKEFTKSKYPSIKVNFATAFYMLKELERIGNEEHITAIPKIKIEKIEQDNEKLKENIDVNINEETNQDKATTKTVTDILNDEKYKKNLEKEKTVEEEKKLLKEKIVAAYNEGLILKEELLKINNNTNN